MRCAILSDIHGNAVALRAVLADLATISQRHDQPVEHIWCLGDIVGYGPEPSECIALVRACCDIAIAGNHDLAATGFSLDDLSDAATASAAWTTEQLNAGELAYLSGLPWRATEDPFTLVHASPTNPIWEYLLTTRAAARNFPAFTTAYCLIGHTHIPMIFLEPDGALDAAPAATLARTGILTLDAGPTLDTDGPDPASGHQDAPGYERLLPRAGWWLPPMGRRAIINPGSVGQPRDRDPRAAYILYDSERGFNFRRVEYDIEETQRRMRTLGLPERMATRLALGT